MKRKTWNEWLEENNFKPGDTWDETYDAFHANDEYIQYLEDELKDYKRVYGEFLNET